ncbi:TIGR03621 family F420-dependent LLM class oxidoreductase [Streptosporangium amethystogenes]|uniref:TIGR03621 family F420-dependent LLM class oxidoreductase n=1 Tax=Streptosporangium amethystogenes TaxID=2002 RepID=UPI0007C71898|nr:TIGR03621 family F420-dependent LLM class oxidoreductase [Streptosporangium amethystogenes]
MAEIRPFRFGVETAGAPNAARWRDIARAVEDLGYRTLLIIDHLSDQLAPVPAMLAAADATTTLRVGSHMLANEFRHPALLAKEAATVDLLSEGRLELGLGAGWNRAEHERIGVELPAPPTRVDRLAEAIAVVKGLLEHESFSFSGRHYALDEVAGLPRPVQRPRPPLMVGGGGRAILSLAAREADIVGLNANLASSRSDASSAATMTGAATAAKVEWIRAAAGSRFDALELSVRVYYTVVTSDAEAAAAGLGPLTGLPVAEALRSPHLLLGDTERLVDSLQEYREIYGISYFVITADAYEAFAGVVSRLG